MTHSIRWTLYWLGVTLCTFLFSAGAWLLLELFAPAGQIVEVIGLMVLAAVAIFVIWKIVKIGAWLAALEGK